MLALDGPKLSIRRFGGRPIGAPDLLKFGSARPEMVEFLAAAVQGRLSFLISGGTGSGKTTLLNCLSGLDDIDGGHVLLDGEDLHALSDADRTRNRASQMGFVFQQFNLIPVLSAVTCVP